MNERITVLLGAGAVTEAADATTANITKAVMEACQEFKTSDGTPILELISNDYNQYCNRVCKKVDVHSKLSFEDYFDVLEALFDYPLTGTRPPSSALITELKGKYSFEDRSVLYGLAGLIESFHTFMKEYI